MLAFEHFHLRASCGEFAAKRSDEWNDRLAVLLIFWFVGNGGLNNKICRHNRPSFFSIYAEESEWSERSGPAGRCPRYQCPKWVKLRRTQCEQMLSGLPLISGHQQTGPVGPFRANSGSRAFIRSPRHKRAST